MIVVSDSTTLIILSNLSRFDFLQNLFEIVFVPSAVYEEVVTKKTTSLPNFIKVEEVSNSETLESLLALLDKGESEAILLAKTKNLPLIIDEKKGRKIALNLNLKIIGLIGVIYLNIKKGFISKEEAKLFLEEAQKNGYRISQKLIDDMFESL